MFLLSLFDQLICSSSLTRGNILADRGENNERVAPVFPVQHMEIEPHRFPIDDCPHPLHPNLTIFTGSFCRDEYDDSGPRTWGLYCSTSIDEDNEETIEGECPNGYMCELGEEDLQTAYCEEDVAE